MAPNTSGATSPIMLVQIPRSQIAAIQAAGQHYLKAMPDSVLREDVADAIETLDVAVPNPRPAATGTREESENIRRYWSAFLEGAVERWSDAQTTAQKAEAFNALYKLAEEVGAELDALLPAAAEGREELEFARTMAPPNAFGAHTMAGLLSDAAEYKAEVERLRALLARGHAGEADDLRNRLRLAHEAIWKSIDPAWLGTRATNGNPELLLQEYIDHLRSPAPAAGPAEDDPPCFNCGFPESEHDTRVHPQAGCSSFQAFAPGAR